MADAYEIIRQEQVLDTSDVTNPVNAMAITFRSVANGTTGTITVPLSDYSPAEVNRRIGKFVADIDAVHDL